MPLHVSAYLRIVTPPRFREKPFYAKLTTFSTAQGTKNETKLIADPKSTSKINVRSRWTVFKILLMPAVKTFCMETRLYNILKTTNATKFIKSISESTYEVVFGTLSYLVLFISKIKTADILNLLSVKYLAKVYCF